MTMTRPSRQAVVVASSLLIGSTLAYRAATPSGDRMVDAAFWFDRVTFDAPALAGPIGPTDLRAIEATARAELVAAFAGLRIQFTDPQAARYRVRVVQELFDPRFRRRVAVAGASQAIAGFGGGGSVSFSFLAHGAIAHAPPGADRSVLLGAIGRGIGRTAVHELTHQLLPTAPIHDSADVESYEYASAARREQYFGPMRWDLARPMLEKRLGRN